MCLCPLVRDRVVSTLAAGGRAAAQSQPGPRAPPRIWRKTTPKRILHAGHSFAAATRSADRRRYRPLDHSRILGGKAGETPIYVRFSRRTLSVRSISFGSQPPRAKRYTGTPFTLPLTSLPA